MKKILLLGSFTLFVNVLLSQQLPTFIQYREYHGYINPASVNIDYLKYDYNLHIGLSHRSQWASKPLTPRTEVLRVEYLFDNFSSNGLILGGYVMDDQTGATGFSGAFGRMAFVVGDPYWGGLSVGLTFGIVQHRIRASEVRLYEQGDVLGERDQTQFLPDVGAGVYYFKKFDSRNIRDDIFYVGASVPQVLGLDLTYKNDQDEFNLKRLRHYFAHAGYVKNTSDLSFVEFSTWAKFVEGAPFNIDVNVRYQLQDFFWIGAGYTSSNTLSLETGTFLGENIGLNIAMKFGYGYSVNFTSFGSRFGGSHEINVAFLIGK